MVMSQSCFQFETLRGDEVDTSRAAKDTANQQADKTTVQSKSAEETSLIHSAAPPWVPRPQRAMRAEDRTITYEA